MINRTHPSDLARFRHTDFGYFAAPVKKWGEGHYDPVETRLLVEAAILRSKARPASIQFKGRWD